MATDSTIAANYADILASLHVAVKRGQISGHIGEFFQERISEVWDFDVGPRSLRRIPVRFAVPQTFNLKTGETTMAVFSIRGDEGTKIPVEFDNIAGGMVPEPAGTPTVTCSDTTVANVRVDIDAGSVDVLPVQPPVVNRPFTITFTLGSITLTQDLVVTPDLVATQGHFVTSDASNFPLDPAPVPAAA